MSQKFASVTEIIKYVEKLLLFACLVFSRTLFQTVYKFQASSLDELSFFPRAGLLGSSDVCKVFKKLTSKKKILQKTLTVKVKKTNH